MDDASIDSLYVVDDEYTDAAAVMFEQGTRIQEIWSEFLSFSSLIVGAQPAITGSRAHAFAQFIELARTHLSTRCLDTTTETQGDMVAYVSSVDAADSVLY